MQYARSLSARRAWIEIVGGPIAAYPIFPSLSARRAWIEIVGGPIAAYPIFVALRKESVDRNCKPTITVRPTTGRSPQGERG